MAGVRFQVAELKRHEHISPSPSLQARYFGALGDKRISATYGVEHLWIVRTEVTFIGSPLTSRVAACTRRARELFSPLARPSTMTKSRNPWWTRDKAIARPVGPAPTISVLVL